MALKHLRDIATLSFDDENCTGCGKCTEVCPRGVFDLTEGIARITDKDLCMECGACALNCPADAITVKAGTGCALAILTGLITGKEPTCDCGGGCC